MANNWPLERIHDLNRQQHYPGGDLTEVGSDYELLRQQAGEMIVLILASVPPPDLKASS